VSHRLSVPVRRRQSVLNKTLFEGDQLNQAMLFANKSWRNTYWFSEWAVGGNGATAFTMGVTAALSARFETTVSVRNYGQQFLSLNATPFAENARPTNEQGWYWGWRWSMARGLTANGFVDMYTFPWNTYTANVPNSTGQEVFMRLTKNWSRGHYLWAQMRHQVRDRNIPGDNPGIESTRRTTLATEWNRPWSAMWESRTRVQGTIYEAGVGAKGWAVMQDLWWKPEPKWQLGIRLLRFRTDGFLARQYVYEPNVLWAWSLPALQGDGWRALALASWKVLPKLEVWAKWAVTWYPGATETGTGNERADGDSQTDVTLQLRYNLGP
jgi:hypothetical protein